jgi:hypothetical protein
MHVFYITSLIFPYTLGLKTPVDAQSKITALTLVCCFVVMLAADNTPSVLVYICIVLEVFFLESGIM